MKAVGASRDRWLFAVIGFWALVVATSMFLFTVYKSTPGEPATAPPRWPDGATIQREPGRATLVMLAHPKCPCTRASLEELIEVIEEVGSDAISYVLLVKPSGVDESWVQGELWERARRVPGLRIVVDEGGVEAARFGAKVSGETLAYGVSGDLLFAGGITASRGHTGDNLGRRRLVALVRGGHADHPRAPTFGCELTDPPGQGEQP